MKIQDFWKWVDQSGECWRWQRSLNRFGYGRLRIDGPVPEFELAHRLAYRLSVGPIPEGMVLDHLCRNRACVNPDHLEPVTRAENVRRGLRGRMVTHCPQGHVYDEANTRVRPDGRRACRACSNTSRKQRQSSRAERIGQQS